MSSIQMSGIANVRWTGAYVAAVSAHVAGRLHVVGYLTTQGEWGVLGGLRQSCPTPSCEEWCPAMMELRALLRLFMLSADTPLHLLLDPSPSADAICYWQHTGNQAPLWITDESRTVTRLRAELKRRPKMIVTEVPLTEPHDLLAGAAYLAVLAERHVRQQLQRDEVRTRAAFTARLHLTQWAAR